MFDRVSRCRVISGKRTITREASKGSFQVREESLNFVLLLRHIRFAAFLNNVRCEHDEFLETSALAGYATLYVND